MQLEVTKTQKVSEHFSLLPSEICRLVLGYLRTHDSMEAAATLFARCDHLTELRAQYKSIFDVPLNVTQLTLSDIIQDYLKISNLVASHASNSGITCRLGLVSVALYQLLNTSRAPSSMLTSRARPSWMPVGKCTLPPRVITHESLAQGFRPPLLVVRPHSYPNLNNDPSSSGLSSSQITETTPFGSRFSSTSRPVIRVYRHQATTGMTSQSEAPSIESFATPQLSLPSAAENITERVTFSPKSETASVLNPLTVETTSGVQKQPNKAASPVPSFLPVVADNTDAAPTDAPALFEILHHLPPPTEGRLMHATKHEQSLPSKCMTVRKQRKYKSSHPRHLPPVSVDTHEAAATTTTAAAAAAANPVGDDPGEDKVDLQYYLSVLFSNPDQVASQINAKIRSQSQMMDLYDLAPTAEQNLCITVDPGSLNQQAVPLAPVELSMPVPCSISSTHSDSQSITTVNPDVPHSSLELFPFSDPISTWLESGEIGDCIDHLLSQFDCTDLETHDKSDSITCSTPARQVPDFDMLAAPPPPPVSTGPASGPFATSQPQVSPLPAVPTVEIRPSARAPSPLCLSQLTDPMCRTPPKRRRLHQAKSSSSSKVNMNDVAVLHTPDTKLTNSTRLQHSSSCSGLVRQDLFTTEKTMQLYEEFVGHHGSQSDEQTDLLPSVCVTLGGAVGPMLSDSATVPPSTSLVHWPLGSATTVTLTSAFSQTPSLTSKRGQTTCNLESQQHQQQQSCGRGSQSHRHTSSPVHIQPRPTVQLSTAYARLVPLSSGQNALTLPQTFILCHTPGRPFGSLEKENLDPSGSRIQGLSLVKTSDRSVVVQLPTSSSDSGQRVKHDGTAQSSMSQPPPLPNPSQWSGHSAFLMPVNVDLDSCGSVPMPTNSSPCITTTTTQSLSVASTAESPSLLSTGTGRRVLNLGSLNVEQILSRSH